MEKLKFGKEGHSKFEIINFLKKIKTQDIPYATGHTFALTYLPNEELYGLIQEAYLLFLTENALDPTAFPSLLFLEKSIIDIALKLMNAPPEGAGNFTFGGTESIICAVKAARDYFREQQPAISRPNLVMPITGHAAFHKACHYLGLELRLVPVDDMDFTPSITAYEESIDENTIMLVASAPSYAHGVIDPIEDIAALAATRDILCHVDACVGGLYLPFLNNIQEHKAVFDFSVKGVTSISMDFHKYGYTAKGASAILYRDAALRKYQIYSCADWTGYSVVNNTVLSSKTGGSMAACWAVLQYMGTSGYEDIVTQCQAATHKIMEYINVSSHYRLLGTPVMNLVAFTSDSINLYQLIEALKGKSWHVQLQFANKNSPTNIHLSINWANIPHIDNFLTDWTAITEELSKNKPQPSLVIPNEMLTQLSPDGLGQLEEMLGISDGNLPQDMSTINALLDALPTPLKNELLKEFVNKMF